MNPNSLSKLGRTTARTTFPRNCAFTPAPFTAGEDLTFFDLSILVYIHFPESVSHCFVPRVSLLSPFPRSWFVLSRSRNMLADEVVEVQLRPAKPLNRPCDGIFLAVMYFCVFARIRQLVFLRLYLNNTFFPVSRCFRTCYFPQLSFHHRINSFYALVMDSIFVWI